MPRIIPILFVIFLAGCGYHGCISQADVWSDVVRTIVYANPGKQTAEDAKIHWVKVDFPFANRQNIKLKIEHHDLNFCENSEIKEIKLEISENDPLTKGQRKDFKINLPIKINEGDKIRFSLNPIKEFTVDNRICRNLEEDVYVSDTDACLKQHIGSKHAVYFSKKIGAQFSNSWYAVEEKGGSPFVTEGVTPYLLQTARVKEGSASELKPEVKNALQKVNGNSGAQQSASGTASICKSDSEIEKEIDDLLLKQEKPPEKKKDEELAKKKEEIRNQREKLAKIFDEYATNLQCGKLCDSWKDTCRGVHLLSSRKSVVGKNEAVEKVIPFVTSSNIIEYKPQQSQATQFTTPSIQDSDIHEDFRSEYTRISKQESGNSNGGGSSTAASAITGDEIVVGKDYLLKPSNDTETDSSGKTVTVQTVKFTVENKHFSGRMAGSYSINVKRDCSEHIAKSLVYTFSKGEPKSATAGHSTGSNSDVKEIKFMENGGNPVNIGVTEGDLYIGVKDNGDGFENNIGYFEVHAKAMKTPPKVLAHVVEWTEKRVHTALYGDKEDKTESVVHKLYGHISQSGPFMRMVNALLVLYVLLSSLYFFLGFSKASMFQLATIIAKIVVVMYVLRPDSWTFFNDRLFNFFVDGPKFLIETMTGGVGSEGHFGFMDAILYRFSVSETWIQLLALLFAGPVGWLSVVLIFWGIIVLVQFLFQAVVIYLISIITIALLLSIAPYFLICILFKRTKSIFDMWIKVLLQTAMQPVLIFSCIALLVNVINQVIYAMLNFEVCDTCIYNVDLKATTLCILSFPLPVGVLPMTTINDTVRELYNTGEYVLLGLPGPIFNILIFVALVNAARDFVLNSGEMCSIMFGAFTNLSEVGSAAAQSILSTIGLDRSTGQMLRHHEQQSALFDRGAGAGRHERSLTGPMSGGGAPMDVGGGTRRRQVIHPADPPASF